MLASFSHRLCAIFRATAPDPFVIAVLLTLLTIALAAITTDHSLRDLAAMWAGTQKSSGPGIFGTDGLWAFLKFAMQMCLILVTGHVLASSAPVSKLLGGLASLPRTTAQGAALIALVGCTLGLLNWGLGLICGAILARRVYDTMSAHASMLPGAAANLPLFAAAGYTPMMIWHGGFSGSAPLTVTNLKDIQSTLGPAAALLPEPIALSRTLFSTSNLIITGGLLIIIPLIMALMAPKHATGAPAAASPAPAPTPPATIDLDTPGFIPRMLENTPIINIALIILIAMWAWPYYFPASGPSGINHLGLDAVNLTMLMLGLLLHGTPRRFLSAVDEAAKGCGGIIIQFPLYAGIMAIMVHSGLARTLADSIAGTASADSLPLLTMFAAAIVNLFIPSGGGQWAVQGPIALDAAQTLGVDPARVVMAVAYGDQLTNMLQPFWALPLLAITRAKARDIIGYTAIAMIAGMLWVTVWMVILT